MHGCGMDGCWDALTADPASSTSVRVGVLVRTVTAVFGSARWGAVLHGRADSRFPIPRALTCHEVGYKEHSALQVYGTVFGDRPAGIVGYFPDVAVRVGEGASDTAPVGGGGAADYRTP